MSLLLFSSTGQCTYPLSVLSSCLRTPQTLWLAPVAYSAGNSDLPTCSSQFPQQFPHPTILELLTLIAYLSHPSPDVGLSYFLSCSWTVGTLTFNFEHVIVLSKWQFCISRFRIDYICFYLVHTASVARPSFSIFIAISLSIRTVFTFYFHDGITVLLFVYRHT